MAKRAAVKSEITDTLRPFYCTLCEKQFQNVAQYDEHTNSYAHHHKARLKDMQANARLVNQEDLEKRKEKERKREEKELRKLARAQGIKMAKPAAVGPTPVLAPENDTGTTSETKPGGFRKAGWAAVSPATKPETDSKRSGWAAVNPAPPLPSQPAPPPPNDPTPVAPLLSASGAPMFRTGGWTSLDSSSSRSDLPPPSPSSPSVPPPPPPVDDAPPPTDALLPPALPLNRHESHGRPALPPSDASPPVRQGWVTIQDSHPSPQSLPPTSLRTSLPPPPPVASTKSGWQQWKQGNTSRRR